MREPEPYQVDIVSLFPELFPGPLGISVIGKALQAGQWQLGVHQMRDHATPPHWHVDDTPFGGGAGQVLRADVVAAAVESVTRTDPEPKRPIIVTSAKGKTFTQSDAHAYAAMRGVIIVCGRYEGIDQRAIDGLAMHEVSIGNYVVSGGEVAALVLLEAILRLREGVLGNPASLAQESFQEHPHAREYPQYTRPRTWRGQSVPSVLLSGHHKEITTWRKHAAEHSGNS